MEESRGGLDLRTESTITVTTGDIPMTEAIKIESKETPQAINILLLRGAIAATSGNDDDPYRMAALVPKTTNARKAGSRSGRQPLLRLDPPGVGMSDNEVRKLFRDTVAEYRSRNASEPSEIELTGVGFFSVARDETTAALPLHGKIALVTGAAGAIGSGVCLGLLEKGCRVAATDLPGAPMDSFVSGLQSVAGTRAIGVPMDVTSKDSVRCAFEAVIKTWGGVDIVVVNAGIAMVSPLVDLDLDAFRRLERVNIEGTLLTIAEAGRCMTAQGTGGDIILISTKNVFAPGAKFGAYSATKAAAHQLARIASIELADQGIRVNMVAPDAVFSHGERKSGLWAEVGPDRMRARGLDEKGLEEYYRSRNLLKASVTPAHVANAVLFFATRQTPTTGATIPVDGGLPDATPR
jgi:NAD(P)-dependent dehydrogenase (short-subunit alcohol dehydrogenase family)